MKPRAVAFWSTGKDAAHAVWCARDSYDVVELLCTVSAETGRVAMHGVRGELLDEQVRRLGLPCSKVALPWPCSNGVYEREVGAALLAARARGVTHAIFGDLFLADLRAWREARMAEVGLAPVFPLWGRDTAQLAREMLDSGLRAVIVAVELAKLAADHAGREFDEPLLRSLPEAVDPCGENGELHTFATASPLWGGSIGVARGERTERDGFAYCDLRGA